MIIKLYLFYYLTVLAEICSNFIGNIKKNSMFIQRVIEQFRSLSSLTY